ncbi:MAG: YlbF family regulator [Ruminococcus sp.]|nr:YlbF family regulator [Ruminococcus sp.]
MSVIEKTRELGKALQEDERYARYRAAKLANDKDESLQKNISEFNSTKMELNAYMAVEDKDTDTVTRLNSKLNQLYRDVTENPNMIAFEAARSEMDDLLSSINYIVTCAANGDDPMTCPENAPACTGSCSTCGGCG